MPYQPAVLGANARLNNFRLNYLTAAQAADRPTHIRIDIGGIDVTQPDAPMRVIYKSLTIRDLLFDAPNTCGLTLYGPTAPTVGQPIEVWINSDAPVLLFGGEVQTVARTYKGRPTTVLHPITAIDDTARANRRRPLRPYVQQSATTIARDLIATYAPGFSSAGVEANLPAVSINFDGSEGGMKGCLTALAKLIGGYWFFENKTLYLFVTPPGPAPDPIDDTPGRFLHDPAITWTIDKSQVRTRCFGKGASTRISAAIAAATTLVPLDNAEMFNAAGGQAIAGITPDGAASRVLTYTGVQLGGGGGLVGPGAAPSAAPGLAPVDGAGIESGAHSYAVTFTTAAGESLPGPVSAITVGLTAPPATAPVPGTPTSGGSVDAGTHYYAVTFVTAAGETTISPGSTGATTTAAGVVAPPGQTAPANTQMSPATNGHDAWNVGDQIAFQHCFVNAAGVTTPGPMSNTITATAANAGSGGSVRAILVSLPISPDPTVTARRLYQFRNGVSQGFYVIGNNTATSTGIGGAPSTSGTPPTTNTAATGVASLQTVPLSAIPIGPANVTARKLYRYGPGLPTYLLLTTIANNTTTTFTDTIANSALGPGHPAANTAAANRVAVTFAIGGSTVTGRKLYRTAAGLSALKLLQTIANNTTTTITDSAADATLGAAAPGADTSGLVQPNGQVPAGSATIIVANTAPFAAAGGWAIIGNGEQAVRYTGKTDTALTGLPASGPGAIVASISYNSTITAAPALVGVTGILEAVIRNSPIHVWVQRDDAAAQAHMITLDGGGDGVYEHIWSDERRTEGSLRQVCDAQLKLYSRPLVTVTYATRDLKTKSGKTVAINLATPAITESLTIQDVAIMELGIANLLPKFTVTASTARQSFEAILQMLIRKAEA